MLDEAKLIWSFPDMKTLLLKLLYTFFSPPFISRMIGKIIQCKWGFFKNRLILWFIDHYHVDMSIAEKSDPSAYEDFNAFFTRTLKPASRPIVTHRNSLIAPVDGTVCDFGTIQDDSIFIAKSHPFRLDELIPKPCLAAPFQHGHFLILYLSPRDYHRIHMPTTGTLKTMQIVPGRLYSVNPFCVTHIPKLFARNERVISLFDTDCKTMALIMVGATIVGSMATTWHGMVTPPSSPKIEQIDYPPSANITLNKGDEMGYFQAGSTVILLFEKGQIEFEPSLAIGNKTNMGEQIATKLS